MKIKDINRKPKHITSIGGQALIEGILMRGPKYMAIAVRKPNKEIELKEVKLNTLGMRYKFFRLPFIRGMVGLLESMVMGMKALMYSVEFIEDEEEYEQGYFEKKAAEKGESFQIAFTILTALIFSIVLFMLIPNLLTSFFKARVDSPIALNFIEGIIRIIIFLIYIVFVSKLDESGDDMGNIFQYHGAEHKSIHCYENGDPLTLENVKKYPILHPRCGTSFMFMVMIVSIFVLSFFGWPNPLKRLAIRLLMLPVITGISYEINRLIGKSRAKLAYYLSYPGLFIQKIATVKEPTDEQIEVAIVALEAVLTNDKADDKW